MIKLTNGISIATSQFDVVDPCTALVPESFPNTHDYNQYLLCCLQQTYIEQLFYYHIPQGFKIYNSIGPDGISSSHEEYFYLNFSDVPEQQVYEYQFTKPLDLLVFDQNNIVLLQQRLNLPRFETTRVVEALKSQQPGFITIAPNHTENTKFTDLIYLFSPSEWIQETGQVFHKRI